MQTVWSPQHAIQIVAGTPPGGGLDRTARALAEALRQSESVDVPIEIVNVPGDGSRKAWAYVDSHRGDPHVVSISHPNLASDRLLGIARFDLSDYTPLAILYTEYIAFAVRDDAALRTVDDLLERLRDDATSITVALSTALGNPNHIALAHVARHAGADPRAPRLRVFDSALDAIDDVLAGNAHVACVTAASAIGAMREGQARVLAISAPQRLGPPFDRVPTWSERGVRCTIGAWRGVAGAHGLSSEHVAGWQHVLARAAATTSWRTALERNGWSATYVQGEALRTLLEREKREVAASLRELGLAQDALT